MADKAKREKAKKRKRLDDEDIDEKLEEVVSPLSFDELFMHIVRPIC